MLSALKIELVLRKNELVNQTIDSIYFGGGTPSLLSAEDIDWLIGLIKIDYNVSDTAEITLEANPDDLSKQKIIDLSNTPINRLSIGIQSFFNDDLKSMNRAHNANEAKECLEIATQYFDNITIDLIYGIPEMNLQKWNSNLQTTFSFGINHISSYALTVEPKTTLDSFIKKGKYPPIDETLALEHFNHLISETQKQGFVHYETSNFGNPNYFSKHNTSYWKGESYLGIGPSAHSYNGLQRSWNVANNTKYIKTILDHKLPQEIETLTKNDRFNEYIMTGLRTIWGISLDTVREDFGEEFLNHLLLISKNYINQNLLRIKEDKIITTQKGKFLIDGIASDLFFVA